MHNRSNALRITILPLFAEALTREAFHNVSYFPGSITTVLQALTR
jgi:hypothetical protein